MRDYDFAIKCLRMKDEYNINNDILIDWINICKTFKIDFSDVFHDNQLKSKKWLVENLSKFILKTTNNNIFIFGGWYGILPYMLLKDQHIKTKYVFNIDKNQALKGPAYQFNYNNYFYNHIVDDMLSFEYPFRPNIVINTSCEHLSREEFMIWYKNIPDAVTVVLQSNNYDKIEEHIGSFESLDNFVHFVRKDLKVSSNSLYFQGKLDMSNFERYMVIFKKPSDLVL